MYSRTHGKSNKCVLLSALPILRTVSVKKWDSSIRRVTQHWTYNRRSLPPPHGLQQRQDWVQHVVLYEIFLVTGGRAAVFAADAAAACVSSCRLAEQLVPQGVFALHPAWLWRSCLSWLGIFACCIASFAVGAKLAGRLFISEWTTVDNGPMLCAVSGPCSLAQG